MSEDEIASEADPGAEPESPAAQSRTRRPWIIIALVVVVAAVAVAGVVALSHRKSAKGAALTLEPAASAGADSFTNSVAVGAPPTFPSNVRAIITQLRSKLPLSKQTQTLVATGTAPGVYGGNGATRSCDGQALAKYLEQNPGNANAWAKASGVAATSIPAYIAALTPVVLTNDTRVTNHGYNNAAPAPRQAVLQAGTAIMVDATGMPRVRCNSGNPLSPTRPIVITKTKGTSWSGYSAKVVTTIKPGLVTHTLTLLNTETGQTYQQPTGNGSAAAIRVTGQWVLAEPNFVGTTVRSTTILAISTSSRWIQKAVISRELVTGLAWGDGKWIAVTNVSHGGTGNHVLESTDLRSWKPVAALPNRLAGIAFGNGRWTATALHYAPAIGPARASDTERVIYSSTDAVHWTQVAAFRSVTYGSLQPVAYGNGEWLVPITSIDSSSGRPVQMLSMITSKDGLHWTANGSRLTGQLGLSLAFDHGLWALGSVPSSGTAVVNTSHDTRAWTSSSAGLLRAGIPVIAPATNGWMTVLVNSSQFGPVSTFLTSPDAKTWKKMGIARTFVSALAVLQPAAAPTTTPGATTTTAATPTPN